MFQTGSLKLLCFTKLDDVLGLNLCNVVLHSLMLYFCIHVGLCMCICVDIFTVCMYVCIFEGT